MSNLKAGEPAKINAFEPEKPVDPIYFKSSNGVGIASSVAGNKVVLPKGATKITEAVYVSANKEMEDNLIKAIA